MKYGRTAHGDRWHALKDGQPLCVLANAAGELEARVAVGRMVIVEVSDGPEVTREDICGNCHHALGAKGRKAINAKSREERQRKDIYRPRHRFEE